MLYAVRLTDVWLQNRAYTLLCVFTAITQVCTGALLISALLHSGSLSESAQTESEASHMGDDVFCHSKEKT